MHPVGDDVQQPLPGGHVVLVPRLDQLPGVPVRIGCRKTEGFSQPVLPVGAVVGQCLAGPFAGGQHAAAGVAEVFAAVRLALARPRAAGPSSGSWAGCRSAASSRTPVSTVPSAAPRRAGRHAPAGRRCRAGPGSARAATVSVRLRCGFILSPSARTGPSRLGPAGEGRSDGGVLHLHPRGQARYPEGGRRREDEPPGKSGAFAPILRDVEHQGDEHLESGPGGGSAPVPPCVWPRRPCCFTP